MARQRTVEVTGDMEAAIMATGGADLAGATSTELASLERLWYDFEPPEGARAELLAGELVMSPAGSVAHARSVSELTDQVEAVKRRHGWHAYTMLTVRIPATRERLIPDLMIAEAQAPALSEWELSPDGVLMVVEVVSPSSRRRDREVKFRSYAAGGIPLYLLIDRFASPASVTLFSEPGPDGYTRQQTAAAGQPLRLPEPFGIGLDTARLLG